MSEFVGIHFGPTCIRVGRWDGSHLKIFRDISGLQNIKTAVAITDEQQVAGDAALELQLRNPLNVIGNLGSLISRNFKRENFSCFIANPDRPTIYIPVNGAIKEYTLEQLVVVLFQHINSLLSQHFAGAQAVVVLPVAFQETQKSLIRACAAQANIQIITLATEPTCAVIATQGTFASNGRVTTG